MFSFLRKVFAPDREVRQEVEPEPERVETEDPLLDAMILAEMILKGSLK